MLFNSLEFAIFFPLVTGIYFMLARRHQVWWLLAASCVFYMAFIPVYILILLVTILIDYFAGIYLEKTSGRARTGLLWVSIISTCAVLFIFKYFAFITGNFVGLAGLFGWHLLPPVIKIILPIGLSFHTFQSLSYVIEVYRGHYKAESDFVTYATYVMFFPQLVAGPIERPQGLLHQFHDQHLFDYARVTSGLKRMAWGFFKKLVVADRLALYVNDVYAAPRSFNGLQLTIATVFFAYQIYCDFSGYSDIAIGAARVLGITLRENFDRPYHAASISEFWHRWHMSLSTWFRDYLYIPMGGSRVAAPHWIANILITFAVSGLWHGANWTYAVWGLLNGFYIIAGTATAPARNRFFGLIGMTDGTRSRRGVRVTCTFGLTLVAWVLFRARTLTDAGYIFTHFWRRWDFNAISTEQFLLRQMPVALGVIAMLEIGEWIQRQPAFPVTVARMPVALRWAGYSTLMVGMVLFGIYRNAQFIYFQF
jgi:D-alanyl-lipoteichoic acid acyltransferase DltB (MBOAT superfamily)